MTRWLCALLMVGAAFGAKAPKKPKAPAPAPLDRYVIEANARTAAAAPPTAGSIWTPGSRLSDAARDLRASQVDDVLTILVVENASAVAQRRHQDRRRASTSNSITGLAGVTKTDGSPCEPGGSHRQYATRRRRHYQP